MPAQLHPETVGAAAALLDAFATARTAPTTGPMAAQNAVATALHEAWRAPRLRKDGTFEERVKDDGNGGTVDIANTTYADLPAKWQADNLAAATSAIEAVEAHAQGDKADTEAVSAAVHVDWLERNGEWAEPEQAVPYAQLSEMEKDKDRSVAAAAAAALGVQLT